MNLKDSYKIYKDNKDFENILIKIAEIIATAKKNAYYSKIDFTKDLFTIWDSLPIIDKTDLNKYTNLLDDEKGFKVYTTGSTGIPTQCIWTNYEYNKAMLSVLKKRIDNGYTKNTVMIFFNGVSDNYQDIDMPLISKTAENTYVFKRIFNENAIRTYSDFIIAQKDIFIYTSPSTIYEFACLSEKFGVNFSNIKCIELNGEMVLQHELKKIKDSFNCNIINNYGCREMWPIAFGDSINTFDVCNDLVFIETNSENELIITSLIKKTQPLIKYKLGDIGNVEWSKSNGKLHQVITELIGRKNDYLILPNNDRIHWATITRKIDAFILKHPDTIHAYAVNQVSKELLDINLVISNNYSVEISSKLYNSIKNILPNMNIKINIVKSILQNKRGKRQYFTTYLNNKGVD